MISPPGERADYRSSSRPIESFTVETRSRSPASLNWRSAEFAEAGGYTSASPPKLALTTAAVFMVRNGSLESQSRLEDSSEPHYSSQWVHEQRGFGAEADTKPQPRNCPQAED